MSLVTMQALLADAEKGGYALGGFVTTDLMVTQSLIQASEEMGAPLILMIPWGTTLDKHRPDEYLRLTVEMARSANVPEAVHLDHGTSYEECIKAINAGFTSVMFDGSSLPMEENIAITKKVVEATHACGITVEAEIGHVGGAEAGALVEGGLEADESCYTTVEEAVNFAVQTGVDCLAVAIGTVHGIYKGTPKLDLQRLADIHAKLDIPLVLHGGSGLSEQDYKNVVAGGIRKINYFTEMSINAANRAREFVRASGDKPIHMMQITSEQSKAIIELVKHEIAVFGWK